MAPVTADERKLEPRQARHESDAPNRGTCVDAILSLFWKTPFYVRLPALSTSRLSVCLFTAINISHIRRILLPELVFIFPHALADMKTAKSSPHYFLDSATDFSWTWFITWSLSVIVLSEGSGRLRSEGEKKASAWPLLDLRGGRLTDLWLTVWILAGILTLEGTFVRASWSCAQLYAYARLLLRGEVERRFVGTLLHEKKWRVTAQLGLILEWLLHTVLPLFRRSWLLASWWVVVVGATVHLVRFSNKYFLWLEMSDIFITLGYCLLASLLISGRVLEQTWQKVNRA